MDTKHDELNILAPREMKPKFDYLHREVQRAAGHRINRREALGLGGMAILAAAAAACGGTTTTTGGGSQNPAGAGGNSLTHKPLENHLEIYNWSQYDDPSTFTKFTKLPAEAKVGMTTHETFYSSNDELLAKLDQVVPGELTDLAREATRLEVDQLNADLAPAVETALGRAAELIRKLALARTWDSTLLPRRGIVRWPDVGRAVKACKFNGTVSLHGEYGAKGLDRRKQLARAELALLKKYLG